MRGRHDIHEAGHQIEAAVGAAFLLIEQRRNPLRGFFKAARARVIPQERVNTYSATYASSDVRDAHYTDVRDRREEGVTQAQIDEILDKISQSGYQSLTEEEKRLLFEASKKLN